MSNEVPEVEVALSQDALFSLLSHTYRSTLLKILNEHEQPKPLADISEEVASAVTGGPVQNADPEEIDRIYLDLYHTHVPKLAEADAVRYNQEDDLIVLTELGANIVTFLEGLDI